MGHAGKRRDDGAITGSASKEGICANRVFRSGTFLSNPNMQRSAWPTPGRHFQAEKINQ